MQPKHPSDKIIEIIHPTTATNTQARGTTGKETDLWWQHLLIVILLLRLAGQKLSTSFSQLSVPFSRQNITYSWINVGDNTTLADYDIAEQLV